RSVFESLKLRIIGWNYDRQYGICICYYQRTSSLAFRGRSLMDIKPIRTDTDYQTALREIETLMIAWHFPI
ncbi:MAG: hypothetical protein OXD47_11140, partial [Gammaproteobacteria bacterium]|nr:hypothetical protein [Gammaproteobacteria bacterium]